MINHWRLVKHTDDGCSVYECLSCLAEWEARTSPECGWKFCPACGTRWNGPLPNYRELANKAWERRRQRWVAPHYERGKRLSAPEWRCESRNLNYDQDWEPDGTPFQGTAKAAWSWLHRQRKNHHPEWEWRILLVSSKERYPLP